MDDSAGEKLGFPAPVALLLTSRLINDEMTDCMRRRKRLAGARSTTDADGVVQDDANDKEGLSLYVSYPYGVLVLKSLYPYLLKQARRVYVSGYYTPPCENEPLDTNDGEHLTPSSSLAARSFNTPASGPSPTFVRPSSIGIVGGVATAGRLLSWLRRATGARMMGRPGISCFRAVSSILLPKHVRKPALIVIACGSASR